MPTTQPISAVPNESHTIFNIAFNIAAQLCADFNLIVNLAFVSTFFSYNKFTRECVPFYVAHSMYTRPMRRAIHVANVLITNLTYNWTIETFLIY